jgi:hypothetical protein
MLTKEDILALAWEYSEGSGKRYTFTEDSLLEMMWVALSRHDHIPRTEDSVLSQQEDSSAIPPVQDEREMGELRIRLENGRRQFEFEEYDAAYSLPAGTHYLYTHPEQEVDEINTSEQQPIGYACKADLEWEDEPIRICRERFRDWQLPVYAAPVAQTAPRGYVLLPKQCPSWLEDAYDDQCEKDKWHGDGLYLPAYDAMVKALEDC